MKTLDLTLPAPAANLACDVALLDWCEEAAGVAARGERGVSANSGTDPDARRGQRPRLQDVGAGVLRFWESPDYFVVVGYSNHISTEVNVAACARRNVPVLRRCSGGGTVVQGPGCLNYALIINTPSESVTETNRFIMERHRAALGKLLGKPVTFDGHTDLALDGKKFSGNSQRRKKRCILFHGTFLLRFDLALVAELLRFPSKQPTYRQGRAHTEFMTNLDLPAEAIKAALRQAWDATEILPAVPTERIDQLVAEKYSTRAWNEKF